MKRIMPARKQRKKSEATMRVGPGGIELVKQGASRHDFSDPYHMAIELSWKGFALAFVGLEFGINVVFAARKAKPCAACTTLFCRTRVSLCFR